jgi:hypothetical protein
MLCLMQDSIREKSVYAAQSMNGTAKMTTMMNKGISHCAER